MGIRKTPISPEYGDPLWNLFRLSPNLSCSRLRLRLPSPLSQLWLLLPPTPIRPQGGPTATNLLRTVAALVNGHPPSYPRSFSHRRWTLWGLSHALASFILTHWVPQGPVALAGDDTV